MTAADHKPPPEMTLERAKAILSLIEYMDTNRYEIQAGYLLAKRLNASHVIGKQEAFAVAEQALKMAEADGIRDELEALIREAR